MRNGEAAPLPPPPPSPLPIKGERSKLVPLTVALLSLAPGTQTKPMILIIRKFAAPNQVLIIKKAERRKFLPVT